MEIRTLNLIAEAIRKNNLTFEESNESYSIEVDDIIVQFQDRENWFHRMDETNPRVSTCTWLRIWVGGELEYSASLPKYVARYEAIHWLEMKSGALEEIEDAKADEVALLLTQYEKYGSVGREEYIQYLIDEEITFDTSLLGEYNEYLADNGYETYWGDLEEMTYGMGTMEVVRACFFGHCNPTDDFFRFNAYANIDSYSVYQVDDEINDDDDFKVWYVENYFDIDKYEMEEHIEHANILIKLGY